VKPLIGTGGTTPRVADEEEALIARLSTLAPALDGEPNPEWQETTRARMMAMAAVRTPEPAVSPLRRLVARGDGHRSAWRTLLTAGLAGAAGAVTALAMVVALSATAGPGDLLYGLKRGTEQTQLALAGDSRGRTLLSFASTRLEELTALVPEEPSADLVADTLATMDVQTADGVAWLTQRAVDTRTSAPLDELTVWSSGQAAGLTELRPGIPADAQADAAASAGLLDQVTERVDGLRTALTCPSGPATEGSDALGPVPGTCAAPAPSVGGGDPAAPPATGAPGGTAAPTPGPSAGDGSTGTDSGSGSGSGSGSDAGSGSGSQDSDASGDSGVLPDLDAPTLSPNLPLPLPSLPTLLPNPTGAVRPPAAGSSAPSSGTGLLPDLDTCLEPLPVPGTC
jgi:hypothetical protein